MNQAQGLEALFEALVASEAPLIAERAIVRVGRSEQEFAVAPYGMRVEIRFGRQAYGSPRLMDIVKEAVLAAQQVLMGSGTKSRHAVGLAELHASGACGTAKNQLLAKLMQSTDRAKLGAARDWLADAEGIPCSIRKEGRAWVLRVESCHAQCARASLRLFNAEWKVVTG